MGIERCPPYSGLFCNIADAKVAIGAPVKKFDECGINLPSSSRNTLVLLRPSFLGPMLAIRDTYRFLFGKCPAFSFLIVWRHEPL